MCFCILAGVLAVQAQDEPTGEEAPLPDVSALSSNLNVPTNIVLAGNGNSVDITWDDTNLDETGYEIERYVSDTLTGTIVTTAADIVAFTESNMGCGLTLWYRVRAVRSGDSAVSPWSDWMSVTTFPCTAACDTQSAVRRVSVGSNNTYQTNSLLTSGAQTVISGGGDTYVLFGSGNPLQSPTSELAGENNIPNVPDVYLYATQNCTTYKFSNTNSGAESVQAVYPGGVDYTGNLVIGFDSTDPDLTSNDGSPLSSVFITDGSSTLLVSLQIPGNTKFIDMVYPYILMSTDGDLTSVFGVGDTNAANDLVLYNDQTHTLSLVTFDYGGGFIANAGSFGGRVFVADDNTPYVVFNSNASNLISGGADSNGVSDVFLRNMPIGFTTRVSLSDTEGQLTTASVLGGYSAVGTTLKVAFATQSRENGSAGSLSQVLLRTVSLDIPNVGSTSLISRATGAAGAAGNGASTGARVSGDGRWVVFTSAANNLVAGDSNNAADVFVRDLTSTVTQRVSKTNAGAPLTMASTAVDISRDGKTILFSSADSTIVTNDTASVCETDFVDSNPALAGVQYDYNDNCTDLFIISNPLAFSATPTNLIASKTFSDKIRLTWSPVSSVQGFKIEASYDNGVNWDTVGTITNGTAASYELLALTCGLSPMLRVSSYVDTPYSLTSPPTVGVTGKTTPCPAPTLQSPVDKAILNTGSLSLRWSKPDPSITGYDVDLSTTATFATHVAGFPQTTATESLNVNSLPDGTYYWKVRTSAPGIGPYSAVGSFTINTMTPAINYGANNTFTLKWSLITWASGYHIQVDNNRDFSSPEYENDGLSRDDLELSISGLEDDAYYWRIRARNADSSWGQWSTPVSFVLDSGHHYGN
ncbi:MAG: hypothetical protein ABI690_16405 [Chloroflexota bacterium]